ncbi:unnamed protein product [Heterobilharzia americana]|nr:unnamed protein product [Heterobilharzia americana]
MFPFFFFGRGTAVSAKYRGAFCEATVDHVDLRFRLRVQLKSNKSCVSVDETCLVSGSPVIGNEVVVRVLNNSAVLTEQVGTVIRVTDSSIYTVVFDDGDKRTLRRTQLVLKGERHFKESESLDCLPLTNPEQFRQPVIDQRRKHRSGEDGSIIDDNMDEVEIEEVEEKVVIKESNQDHEFDKGISLKDAVVGDPNCSNITERGVDVEETHLSDANTVNVSDVEATDLKHLPTGYRRLLGRLVMVDMPLTGKDCFGSPSYGSSTPVSKSPGLTPKRRFTPAVVVLPSAMPSICLGNISNTCDGGSTDNNTTRMQKSYKLLVRSFKDNRFIAVPIAFLKRLKRPNAVELAHTHPTLRSAFERALLWLDRYEFPVSWGENAVQSMLGTKNWRSSKHHCRPGSDVTESMNFTSSSLKHSRTSSPSSSEASHSPNNCRESIQKSSGKSTTKKPEKVARKRPRLTDKTQGSRSSSRLKVKRFKANILISSDTGYRRSDGSSNESNFDFSKKSAIKRNSVKKNAANQKPNKKNTVSSDDLSDSISSDEASSNSVDSDCDTRSLSSSSSSTSNLTSSSVSTVSSTSSSSSSSSSDSNISSSSSSTTRSYLSSDNSSTSSVAGFEARDRWIAQLYRFMDERGTPINKAPSLANKDLDLYKLYKLVHKLGGFHRVSSQLKWGYVYSKMDLPQNFSAGPRNLQAAFKKYLYPWDDITKKLGTNLCELPSSRPRYSSSVQNSNPVVTTCASNNSVSVSTSVSGNNTKSSRIKQSSDSVNLDTERKNNIDVIETTETSNTEEDKNVRTTAVTNTTSIIPTTAATTTTTATKKRASDKNCVIDQQSASYFKQTNDEYIAHTTPIRKSNSSSENHLNLDLLLMA